MSQQEHLKPGDIVEYEDGSIYIMGKNWRVAAVIVEFSPLAFGKVLALSPDFWQRAYDAHHLKKIGEIEP